jgi:hypothetical protein
MAWRVKPSCVRPPRVLQVRQRDIQRQIDKQQREMELAAVRMEGARMDAAVLAKQYSKQEQERYHKQVRVHSSQMVLP